jgi:hypothetical protein
MAASWAAFGLPGAMAPGMAYQVGDDAESGAAIVQWEDGPVHLTADEAVRAEEEAPAEASTMEEAMEYLRQLVAAGPIPAAAAIQEAAQMGFNETVLLRARRRLGIKTRKKADGWVCRRRRAC